MTSQTTIRTIDDLLAREGCTLMQRLGESSTYIPHDAIAEAEAVERMIAEETQHGAHLVELLTELRATPGPRGVCTMSGNLHYNTLHALLPRLIADKRELIGAYEQALAAVANEPHAAGVVSQLLADHRRHLTALEELEQKTAR